MGQQQNRSATFTTRNNLDRGVTKGGTCPGQILGETNLKSRKKGKKL